MLYSNMFYCPRWLTILVCCAVTGCGIGSGGPQRATTSGTVTIDGQPVSSGSIQFVPTGDTTGPVVGGIIEIGKYAVPEAKGPILGTYCVEINSSKKTGRKVPGPTGRSFDEHVSIVPA